MVTITDNMRQVRREALREYEAETDRRIKKAVEEGKNRAVFPLDYTDMYFDDLRDLYEQNGYRVERVGIVGGVLQRDHYITW